MSWEWSHAPEAYDNAKENLANQNKAWLEVCWAEIMCAEPRAWRNRWADNRGYEFDKPSYLYWLETAKLISEDSLIDSIWKFAQEYRTCSDGGFDAHCCPFGCHTVSFDLEEE